MRKTFVRKLAIDGFLSTPLSDHQCYIVACQMSDIERISRYIAQATSRILVLAVMDEQQLAQVETLIEMPAIDNAPNSKSMDHNKTFKKAKVAVLFFFFGGMVLYKSRSKIFSFWVCTNYLEKTKIKIRS